MSELTDIQELIQDTSEMLAHLKAQFAQHPDNPLLSLEVRSLERRRAMLEERFLSERAEDD